MRSAVLPPRVRHMVGDEATAGELSVANAAAR